MRQVKLFTTISYELSMNLNKDQPFFVDYINFFLDDIFI